MFVFEMATFGTKDVRSVTMANPRRLWHGIRPPLPPLTLSLHGMEHQPVPMDLWVSPSKPIVERIHNFVGSAIKEKGQNKGLSFFVCVFLIPCKPDGCV